MTTASASFAASDDSLVHSSPPNIFLILADDMAHGDLAILNGGLSCTPRLDQLMGESVFCSRGYSAAPVSAPARAAMLTGRYPHRTGVTDLNKNTGRTRLYLDETTIADIFSATGYMTGLVGKWHCGDSAPYHPLKRGFQEFSGYTGDHYGKLKSYYDYALEIKGQLKTCKGSYMTDHFTDMALDFVRRHQDRPFFLHLAYNAPHRPLGAPEELIRFYREKGFDEETATVYAMVEEMDRGIGLILDELDKLGLADNTIVIFASDNGPDPYTSPRFNSNLRGTKYSVYEGGIHVPIMIRWPGKLPAGKNDAVVHFIDFLPTLASACDIRLSGELDIDGVDMMDVLRGNAAPPKRQLFWQWNRGLPFYTHNGAVLDGEWKLVRPFVSPRTMKEESTLPATLFNLRLDPEESKDLASEDKTRSISMNHTFATWAEKVEKERLRKVVPKKPSIARSPAE